MMGKGPRTVAAAGGVTHGRLPSVSIYHRIAMAVGAGLLLVLLAAPAQAITIQGGTPEQQAYAQHTIEECRMPYKSVERRLNQYGGVSLTFLSDLSGYGADAFGAAWHGHILIHDIYDEENPVLGVVVAHEFAHQIWFVMSMQARIAWMNSYGYGGTDWWTSPAEQFAECMRYALFESTRWYPPQTHMQVVSAEDCWAFIMTHYRVPWSITLH